MHITKLLSRCRLPGRSRTLLQVVIPEDEDWEIDYHQHQSALLSKYHSQMPPEFQESAASQAEALAEDWQPAPRITEADHTNDQRSLLRKLDRRLIFAVQIKGDNPGGLCNQTKFDCSRGQN